jgi:hypothetical protein
MTQKLTLNRKHKMTDTLNGAQGPQSEFARAVAGLLTEDDNKAPTKNDKVVEAKGAIVKAADANTKDELTADPLLVQILSTRRSHGSQGDKNFRLWLFNYIKSTLKLSPTIEAEGNILVQTDPKSTVLFSCHVDTVHGKAESDGKSQQLAFDPAFGHLFLADKSNTGCLGGDDGCGVYIMLKMLKAGVKGKFIFHVGEECGGIGSRAFVKTRKQFCEDIEMVVAFDRAVRTNENPEVILTQGGQTCASLEFGEALCKALNKVEFDLPYIVSHKGSFTDSKVYRDTVPECVNIGCFYQHQHGPNEYVDVVGLERLVNAAIQVEWSKLPIIRNPLTPPPISEGLFGDDRGFYAGMWHGGDTEPANKGKKFKGQIPPPPPKPQIPADPELTLLEELDAFGLKDFTDFVLENPDAAASALVQLTLKVRAMEAELDGARTMLGI